MNFQDYGRTLPDNVVAFPGVHRSRPQHQSLAHEPAHPAPPHRRAAVMSGAELNTRLMVLLGICVTSAAAVVSAAHFLQG
jgi:hypothetical protein